MRSSCQCTFCRIRWILCKDMERPIRIARLSNAESIVLSRTIFEELPNWRTWVDSNISRTRKVEWTKKSSHLHLLVFHESPEWLNHLGSFMPTEVVTHFPDRPFQTSYFQAVASSLPLPQAFVTRTSNSLATAGLISFAELVYLSILLPTSDNAFAIFDKSIRISYWNFSQSFLFEMRINFWNSHLCTL